MQVIKAIKKLADEADGDGIFWFVICLVLFPPITLIWLAIRIIQEIED